MLLKQRLKMGDWKLILIIVYALVLRFWRLGIYPPMADHSYFTLRLFSALSGIGSLMFLYLICKKLIKTEKIALLSSFIFAILPWTIEQGRIVSEPNFALFWVLFLLFLFLFINSYLIRLAVIVLILLLLYSSYPHLWLFKITSYNFNLNLFIRNFLTVASFDLLFFRNNSFWWGGVRDTGIMLLSLLPFFVIGILQLLTSSRKKMLIWVGIFGFIYAANPFFPEGREFFLATPIISLIISFGIYRSLYFLPQKSYLVLLLLVLSIFIYDFASFLHYYTVHYQQEVQGYLLQIHDAF